MIFAVFERSPLTVCINCGFYIYNLNNRRFALRAMLPVNKQNNSTFVAAPAAGEIRAPPNLAQW